MCHKICKIHQKCVHIQFVIQNRMLHSPILTYDKLNHEGNFKIADVSNSLCSVHLQIMPHLLGHPCILYTKKIIDSDWYFFFSIFYIYFTFSQCHWTQLILTNLGFFLLLHKIRLLAEWKHYLYMIFKCQCLNWSTKKNNDR